VIVAKQGADIALSFKIDYQITFLGHFTIGKDMLQNSDFSHKGPFDAVVVSCVRPYRGPIPHASVAHEGMISELHGVDLIKIAQGCQQKLELSEK